MCRQFPDLGLDLIMQVPVMDTGSYVTGYIDIMASEEEEELQEQVVALVAMGFKIRSLAIQLAVNSVWRETIDVRNEIQ
jgi:Holliday junction resolvasome RuvABC DNA-binding subunit